MPDTFQIATEAPIGEFVAKQYVEFPVLLVDDLLPWCAELKAYQRRVGEAKLAAQKMADFDLWRARKHLDEQEVTLDNLQSLVSTIPGAKRVLLLSLAKAGRPEDEAKAIVSAVKPYRLVPLAIDVSQLLPPPAAMMGGGQAGGSGSADPNAGAGESAGEKLIGST